VILLVGAFFAQGLGYLPTVVPFDRLALPSLKNIHGLSSLWPGENASSPKGILASAFSKGPSDDLLSQNRLLGMVGTSPADPSRVLFPAFEKSVFPDWDKVTKACPPGQTTPAAPAPIQKAEAPVEAAPEPALDQGLRPRGAPQLVETPLVKKREPSEKKPPEDQTDKETKKPTEKEKVRPEAEGARKAAPARPTETPVSVSPKPDDGAKKIETAAPDKPSGEAVSEDKKAEAEGESKPEKYQLPGSLRLTVAKYKGTRVKWGLMVILDDSAFMGRKGKPWEPNRMEAASSIVGKLRTSLTPGSKLAVRDFYCRASKRRKGRAAPRCLSHMLYDWADVPCKGMEEKLQLAKPGGRTNPCAAAAYSLKKDFSGIEDLAPRLVVVTNGATKCAYRKVLRMVDRKGARGKVKVDVIAMGMSKRRRGGYVALAKKTRGVFLNVNQPADVPSAVSQYGKVLKKPIPKKMEVRGEKASFKVGIGDEITLAPGTYAIVLPVIPGLDPSNRIIRDVKIDSGQARVLSVRIKKGRLVVSPGKK
jgi:hypothetical protein